MLVAARRWSKVPTRLARRATTTTPLYTASACSRCSKYAYTCKYRQKWLTIDNGLEFIFKKF